MLKKIALRGMELARLEHALMRAHRGELKVLLYHNVDEPLFGNAIAGGEFARHLEWLKKHCNVVSIRQDGTIDGAVDDRLNVLISFDDGFINNAEAVTPLLTAAGLSAIFFVIVDCLAEGAVPGFQQARLGPDEDPTPYRTVTVADIRAMRAAGMAIGSHSLGHTDMREKDDAALLDDARQSRARLEEVLGETVGCFAFPWGHHNSGQPEKLLDVYDKIFLTRHGFAATGDRILPRNEVANLAHLPHAVAGTVDLLRR